MANKICAAIVTIGDELLIGQTIDTNSAWLGQELNSRGIWLNKRVAVGDNKDDIITALDEVKQTADIIIITGGLGPTADDITKPLLCDYFKGQLIENTAVKEHVIDLFRRRGRKIIDVNLKQAMVPDCCTVLFNDMGTAPGMLFEQDGKVFISLPGVPFEMKHIMNTSGFKYLIDKFNTPTVEHRTLVTSGEGESFIAEQLKDFEAQLNPKIKLAYLPQLGIVKLRLTAIDLATSILDEAFATLYECLKEIVYAKKDISLAEAIYELCTAKGKTLALAESCTGGHIASVLTNIPKSSQYFKGSIVSYTNEIKENILHVNATDINAHTAVSEVVCHQMAENAAQMMKSDYAISITGYLDNVPEGFNSKGIVFIGITANGETTVRRVNLMYDRLRNKELATNIALSMLHKAIR